MQTCCTRDYKNRTITWKRNYVTCWNCTGSILISSSIHLLGLCEQHFWCRSLTVVKTLGLDAMIVWPNFVAGGQKILCGLNYRTNSNLNIHLWKPTLRKLKIAEWEEVFYLLFSFHLVVKIHQYCVNSGPIPMPVSNLQLDICGEIKRSHDREDEWVCWTKTMTYEQWYPLPLMKESALFIDIAYLWLCVTWLEWRLQYTAVYVATFI